MALATFSDLKTGILSWSTRTELTTEVVDFITLAEARLNYGGKDGAFPTRGVRTRQNTARTTLTITGEYLTIPVTDFLEAKNVSLGTPHGSIGYITPEAFEEKYAVTTSGIPRNFTVIGEEIRFGPTPASHTGQMVYYQKIPALSDSNTTNWLLTDYPNVYLYGGLLELSIFIQEDADIEKYGRLFAGAVGALQDSDADSEIIGTPQKRSRHPQGFSVRI